MYEGIYRQRQINELKKEILKWELKYSTLKEEHETLFKRYQLVVDELIRYKTKFGLLVDEKTSKQK